MSERVGWRRLRARRMAEPGAEEAHEVARLSFGGEEARHDAPARQGSAGACGAGNAQPKFTSEQA
ncbi:hypothetical protein FHX42_004983 [Saccharopolyspora lacisalsi]|uniref:Uncharacterized protein n=1 Tax=Halosaccharopolyspora lacisalsi TaxID=1000566 RepID=A0A839E7B3_9PSEU|nr:hypothetical protein [Halosaccharopolyspora lacisalsi]